MSPLTPSATSIIYRMTWLIASLWMLCAGLASIAQARELKVLADTDLHSVASLADVRKSLDPTDPTSHLSHILIPRPSGSENNTHVRNHIINTLKKLNWAVEEDSFEESTPYGVKQFTNVIATWDPAASSRLIMSAHFDSKFFSGYPQNQFVGATDSAAPCAMLLDLAESLSSPLKHRHDRLKDADEFDDEGDVIPDTTLQLVFFDGEEAFKDWRGQDNTYGSRHLAEKWATEYLEPHHTRRRLRPSTTMLSTIEHLVLLDLLGAAKPLVQSYFSGTAWLFDSMVEAEHRLGAAGIFNVEGKAAWETWDSFFVPRTAFHDGRHGYIEDDHVPFLRRGVSILHVITNPFPQVWHTIQDDVKALDVPTMERWALIMRVFVVEYMGLLPDLVRHKEREDRAELLSKYRSLM